MAPAAAENKVTLPYLRAMKQRQRPITMLTAYDYPTAVSQDQAAIDIIFVGDSLGTNVLGYRSSQQVTLNDMLHHARAVRRGVKRALLLVDLPFMSYQTSVEDAVRNAGRLVQEAGAEAVKLEGGTEVVPQVRALAAAGVAVMGHIGFTPQSQTAQYYLYSDQRGTVPKYQGKGPKGAAALVDMARRLEDAGVFALVLEMVTEEAAQAISERLQVPVIGIGSGRYCDGQVLTSTDVLGINAMELRLGRRYASFAELMAAAFQAFRDDVISGSFPSESNLQHMEQQKLAAFRRTLCAHGDHSP